MCFKPLRSSSFCAHVTAVKHFLVYVTVKCAWSRSLDVWWSPRPQAARPVHQWQLLGETTGEPGPFGGPNNNVNGRAEGQEAQPDRPVLRKALFSEGGLLGKKQWQGLFQPENTPVAYFQMTSLCYHSTLFFFFLLGDWNRLSENGGGK